MMAQPTGISTPPFADSFPSSPPVSASLTRQSTNPFAKSSTPPLPTQQFSPSPDQFQQQQQPPQTAMPLQTVGTGSNPFARNMSLIQHSTSTITASADFCRSSTSTNGQYQPVSAESVCKYRHRSWMAKQPATYWWWFRQFRHSTRVP